MKFKLLILHIDMGKQFFLYFNNIIRSKKWTSYKGTFIFSTYSLIQNEDIASVDGVIDVSIVYKQ